MPRILDACGTTLYGAVMFIKKMKNVEKIGKVR
jgi:hypothetical protein